MNKSILFFVLLFLSQFASNCDGRWEVVSENLATILTGVHFSDANHGYVVGAQNGVGPVILQTPDGGQTWYNQAGNDVLSYLDIDFAADGRHGVASGLGAFFAFVGSSWTTDAATWRASLESGLAVAYQDVQVLTLRESLLYGEWAGTIAGSGTGVAISNDFGFNYHHYDWAQGTSARYGWFVNSTYGFLAGGEFPSNDSMIHRNSRDSHSRTLSKYLRYSFNSENGSKFVKAELLHNEKHTEGDYRGVIARTVDGGKTWTTQHDNSGKYYFNGIQFVDANNGWAVAEGSGDGVQNAFIFNTKDGGNTWTQQLMTSTGGSLFTVRMVDANEGWAVGGTFSTLFSADFWHTTDGGANWKLVDTKFGYFITNVHIVDRNTIYATGLSLGGCSVFKYFPE